MTVVYVIIGIIVILLIYSLGIYNTFVEMKNKVNEAFATMDVYLKKRWDLIPSIVECVKGYSKYESDTLVKIVSARNYDALTKKGKEDINMGIANEVANIMALSEQYPDLKANESYLNLMENLKQVENDIANSRKYYNAVVKNFDIKIQSFPNNIFAKIFGFKEIDMFQIKENEKGNVSVKGE